MKRKFLLIIGLAAVIFLFCVSAFISDGYDDEISSIFFTEKADSVLQIIRHTNNMDFHPPGMYIINYLLYNLLGSWHLVRPAGALAAALCIWLLWYVSCRRIRDKFSLAFSYIAVCMNPSVMMWCTSLRWYTYFASLTALIAVLIHKADDLRIKSFFFWGIYSFICVIMFYINYLAVMIIPVSFLCIILRRRKIFMSEYKCIAVYAALFLMLISYQAYILLTVHYRNSGGSFFPFMSFLGGGMNFLSGQAVVPVSFYGVLLSSANFILFLTFLKNLILILSHAHNNFLVLSYGGIMSVPSVGGTGLRARNFVILSPELGVFLTDVYGCLKNKFVKLFILCAYIIGTSGGIYNVITHNNTTKAGYNMPYKEIINYALNTENVLLVSGNPVLMYLARENNINSVMIEANVYENESGLFMPDSNEYWYDTVKNWDGPVMAVRTYAGSIPQDESEKFMSYIDLSYVIESCDFGADKFAYFKRILDKEYPDYYARVYLIDNNRRKDK